jgi:signal transduction histidine kinase
MEATKNKRALKRNSQRSSLVAGRALYRWRLLLARSLYGSRKTPNFLSHHALGVGKGVLPRNKFLSVEVASAPFSGERRVGAAVMGGNQACALAILRKLRQTKQFGARSGGPAGGRSGFTHPSAAFHSVPGGGHLFGGRGALRGVAPGEIDRDGDLPKYSQGHESRDQIFVRVVRHELLTPLSGVVGMLDLVDNKGLLDPSGKLSLKHAKDSARALVEQLLLIMEYTSLLEGQLAPNFRNIQLPQLLRELTAVWKIRAEAKGLKFVVQTLPGAPLSLKVDPHCFRRLMEILLSNAVKFTHSGEVAIGVGPGPRIWVRDSGIGISQEQQAVIFQPFKQIDESLARKHAGMGLGLAVASHLANAMKGLLSVTSQPGKGSVFSFKLPASVTKLL